MTPDLATFLPTLGLVALFVFTAMAGGYVGWRVDRALMARARIRRRMNDRSDVSLPRLWTGE